jgi:hypothetical protein
MSRFNDSTSDQVGEYYQAQSWRREGVKEERERIIKLLKAEIERVSNPMLVDREYLDGLETAVDIVEGESNE